MIPRCILVCAAAIVSLAIGDESNIYPVSESKSRAISAEYAKWVGACQQQIGFVNSSDDERLEAIYLLGQLRSDGSIRDLLPVLTLRDKDLAKRPWIGFQARWGRYPAAEALIKIGTPSLPPMIETLKSSDDPETRNRALRVICGILGPSLGPDVAPDVIRVIFEKNLSLEQDPRRAARLREVLESLRRGDPWKREDLATP